MKTLHSKGWMPGPDLSVVSPATRAAAGKALHALAGPLAFLGSAGLATLLIDTQVGDVRIAVVLGVALMVTVGGLFAPRNRH